MSMRILLAHNFYQQSGGEDVVFYAETELLRRHGHEVRHYTEHNDRIRQMSRPRLFRETLWSTATLRHLKRLLKEWQPDVVHFHNTFPLISPAAYYACRRVGVPVVQTLHNYRLLCPAATFYRSGKVCEACLRKTPPLPSVQWACYRNSRIQSLVVVLLLSFHRALGTWKKQVDAYISLTDFARRKFIEGGIPGEKILVKPNFLLPDPGKGKSAAGDYALFVGRFSPEKGISILLQAWCRMNNIPLKVAGDGPMGEEIRKYVTDNDLKTVECVGKCSHEAVLGLMKNARFLVFPSQWYEGFPMTIAEAFACGLPVIASNLGAMAEIIDDGRTGLLFNPGDAQDLAAKVKWAWEHPQELARMGKEARREYEAKYTEEQNYKMLMQIYEQARANYLRR